MFEMSFVLRNPGKNSMVWPPFKGEQPKLTLQPATHDVSADIARRVGYIREDYWIPKRG